MLLKYLHISSVAASFAFFVIRGIWTLRAYPPAPEPWVRIVPHAVDAVMLTSALAMLYMLPSKGWPGDWMTVKILLLAAYVVLSLFVLKWFRVRALKFVTWILALLVFLFITSVAVLQHPMGIFSLAN